MKKLFRQKTHIIVSAFFLISMPVFFASCVDDFDSAERNTVTTNTQTVNFDVNGGAETFNITSRCAEWRLVVDAATRANGWYSVNVLEGRGEQTITITAQRNLTGAERRSTLIVRGVSNDVRISIVQAADGPNVLTLDRTSLLFLAVPDGGQNIQVTAEFGFQVTARNANPAPPSGMTPWYNFTPAAADGNSTVVVTLTPNDTGTDRTVTLVFRSPTGKEVEVLVSQSALNEGVLDVNPSQLRFEVLDTAQQTFDVMSPVAWNITAPGLTGTTVNGFTLSAISGDGNTTVIVTPTPNGTGQERDVTLTVSSGGLTRTVLLRQAADGAGVLDITPVTIELEGANPASQTFTVTSAFDWTIDATAALAQGFTVTPTSGTGSPAPVTVTVGATGNNTTGAVRTAQITVSNSAKSGTVTINQGLPTLVVTPVNLGFTAINAINRTFTVTSDLDWSIDNTAAATAAGFTVTPSSGTGSAAPVTVTVSASNNSTGLERIVSLNIVSGGVTRNVALEQEADGPGVLDSDHANLTQFAAIDAALQEFHIISAFDWTVTVVGADAAAFRVTPLSGVGGPAEVTITVEATDNLTTNIRNAMLRVTNSAKVVDIPLSQAAGVLR